MESRGTLGTFAQTVISARVSSQHPCLVFYKHAYGEGVS